MNKDVINCPACSRKSPAARATCLYCGEPLPVTQIEAAPPQRNIDDIERAFNTVLVPGQSSPDERAEAALAAALKIDLQEARAFIAAGKCIPLARSQTRQEAELIATLVRTCWLNATVVPDEDLRLEKELIRARKVLRSGEEFEVHHSGGKIAVPIAEVKLLVVGALKNVRVDYTEGMSGMSGQSSRILDTAEFHADEVLLDVYGASLDRSFRIRADAFDYSGLVSPLAYRSEMNFQAAVNELRSAATGAAIDEDFSRIRGLLARAWPARSRVESRGLKRTGLSHRPVAQSSLTSDNRDQFNRYSRLMFLSIGSR